jgi:pSer/pThr/pTyr-binding forkhead associated (FHA) protein
MAPAMHYRDPTGCERAFKLEAPGVVVTIGRRQEADLCLPWDPEVSRLHAELALLAGEWTLADDGLSQNGTFVNGLRLVGRRRLQDGDLVTVGRTTLTYRDPSAPDGDITLASSELLGVPAFSEQQQRILRALCEPLLGDGEGVVPADDQRIARAVRVPEAVVATELDHLARAFGLEDSELDERRREIALLALRAGLVRASARCRTRSGRSSPSVGTSRWCASCARSPSTTSARATSSSASPGRA